MSKITTVLFDLDGTLLDTAPDMAYALNILRRNYHLPELPLETIRPRVGHGGKALLKLGFDIDETHHQYSKMLEEYFTAYDQCLTRSTKLFAGMSNVLEKIEEKNIPWGIITNKPARFTHHLLDALELSKRSACTVCGDTLPQRKPNPAQLIYACNQLDRSPINAIYVGDAAIDMMASKAAGIHSLAALYGYIGADENPQAWEADGYVNSPEEILRWI